MFLNTSKTKENLSDDMSSGESFFDVRPATHPDDVFRFEQLGQFLKNQGLDGELIALPKDMSNRRYYRLKISDHESLMIMDAPSPELPDRFVMLSDYLLKNGIHAPKVFAFDEENGFVVLEDFGDHTFTYVLDNIHTESVESDLYITALKVLQRLWTCKRPIGIDDYTVAKYLAEVEVFIDWYWQYAKGVPAPALAKQPFMRMWESLFQSLPQTQQTLVLRDYHVDNLMIIGEQLSMQSCGVLDFQDALWGSAVYDVVSLLEDARRDVSADVIYACTQFFIQQFPKEMHDAIEKTAKVLAAARHVKVIGVFTRYAIRQKNHSKCVHLPRLWRYLDQHFKDPIFEDVAEWFQMHFPIEKQIA